MDNHRCAKSVGHAQVLFIVEVSTNLRQVAAVVRAGVDVDAVRAAADDLLHEQIGDPAGERPLR